MGSMRTARCGAQQRQCKFMSLTHTPAPRRCCEARRRRSRVCKAAAESSSDDVQKSVDMLNKMMEATEKTDSLTGEELRQLLLDKWGKSFDVRLLKRSGNMYLHVMWKFLEQQSFPLTEDEYEEQLNAVAELCSLWGVSEIVRNGIVSAHDRGPGFSVGGAAKAIQIPLGRGLDMMGGGR